MTAKLFASILAGVLMVPHAVAANDAAADAAASLGKLTASSSHALPLPPIQHLETIPWLTAGAVPRRAKIDVLLGPKFESLEPSLDHRLATSPSMQSRDVGLRK
jgi:hypothetical protein